MYKPQPSNWHSLTVGGRSEVFLLHMNKGTVSSHLSRLEQENYIKVSKTYRGNVPQTLLSLTAAGREAFQRYRENLKEVL